MYMGAEVVAAAVPVQGTAFEPGVVNCVRMTPLRLLNCYFLNRGQSGYRSCRCLLEVATIIGRPRQDWPVQLLEDLQEWSLELSEHLRRGYRNCRSRLGVAGSNAWLPAFIMYTLCYVKNKGIIFFLSLHIHLFTHIRIDEKWCTVQCSVDENHLYLGTKNL